VNVVILEGRLTRDPETRSFPSGAKVGTFSLAVNKRVKNQAGTWEDKGHFFDCKVFQGANGSTVDNFEKYASKGRLLLIRGTLEQEQWEDKTTGQKRSKVVVIVDEWKLLDFKEDGGKPQKTQGQTQPQPQPRSNTQARPYDGADDGIPF
jgi:single-strand DNA-binding protein